MKLVRVEISEVGLGEPGVGLDPEPMGSALGDGSAIVERGDARTRRPSSAKKPFTRTAY
jgi:hypothetical protein